jgi:PIN domain nuclease of toxin-antitoxin system
MKLLLDTHAFLWFVQNDRQLSATARALIVDPTNEVLISPANYWELAIKVGLGKYTLQVPIEQFLDTGIDGNDFTILPILPSHVAVLTTLPFHHRDPFDRLLVAQAIVEAIPLVSCDANLDPYAITRLW